MHKVIWIRTFASGTLAAVTVLLLNRVQGSISLGELLATAVFVSTLCSVAACWCRSPRQFMQALYEHARYMVMVPLCALLSLGLLMLSLACILVKIALKGVFTLLYVISPIDLVLDMIPVVGLIDDYMITLSFALWVVRAGARDELRHTVTILRPTTPFP